MTLIKYADLLCITFYVSYHSKMKLLILIGICFDHNKNKRKKLNAEVCKLKYPTVLKSIAFLTS